MLDNLSELGIGPGAITSLMMGKKKFHELFNGKFAEKINGIITDYLKKIPLQDGETEACIFLRSDDNGDAHIVITTMIVEWILNTESQHEGGKIHVSRIIRTIPFKQLGDFIRELQERKD